MVSALWQGLVLGFGLAFLLGPAFFALLDASLHYGLSVSVAIALGVVGSDILLLLISYLSLNELSKLPYFQDTISFIGSFVLFGSGWIMIARRNENPGQKGWNMKKFWSLFVKGFSINTFNPFPWLFWFSTATMVKSQFGPFGWQAPVLFFTAATGMVLTTDILKAALARYLVPYLKAVYLVKVRVISGLCLMAFGIKLFWIGLSHW